MSDIETKVEQDVLVDVSINKKPKEPNDYKQNFIDINQLSHLCKKLLNATMNSGIFNMWFCNS